MIVYARSNTLIWALIVTVVGQIADVRAEEPAKDGRVRLYVAAKDPYGGKLTFKWEQLDGPNGKILDATAGSFDDKGKKWISETHFIPSKPGTYTFQVTVANDEGVTTKKRFVMEAKKSGSE